MGKTEPDNLQRLLDYHLHLDDPEKHRETQRLLVADTELQELDVAVRRSLAPLGNLQDEEPPVGLATRTLQLVSQHRQAQQLAEASVDIVSGGSPRDRTSRMKWVISNFRDVIAIAASIMLVFVLMKPGLQRARQISQEHACASQFRSIGFGLAQYAQQEQGRMPYVERPQGAKWLDVGKQGDKHYSNTRNAFLLVKLGYVSVDKFLCPGVDTPTDVKWRVTLDPQDLKNLQDFADRHHVNYSFFLVLNNQSFYAKQSENIPIGSDQNPIFADYDSQRQSILDLSVRQDLLSSNSPNHAGRGQNLLYGDGHIRFSPVRHVGVSGDDIFTLENILQYDGDEQPRTESDILHAP